MSPRDHRRLIDLRAACEAIAGYLASDPDLTAGLTFDAIRMRLVEIWEAAKDLSAEVVASEPTIQWRDITGMRDILTHHYFDTSHAIVRATARDDIPVLHAAVERLLDAGS